MDFGGILSGGMQANPFAQYKQMQANPFTRQIPGTEYLSGMSGMSGGNLGPMGMSGAPGQADANVPTDFAGVPPGLPNLPENLQGFGFGQMAPEVNVNGNLQENLLQTLIQQLLAQNAPTMSDDGFGQDFGSFY